MLADESLAPLDRQNQMDDTLGRQVQAGSEPISSYFVLITVCENHLNALPAHVDTIPFSSLDAIFPPMYKATGPRALLKNSPYSKLRVSRVLSSSRAVFANFAHDMRSLRTICQLLGRHFSYSEYVDNLKEKEWQSQAG